jgi:TorA maturation chaperone TorD
MATGNEQQLSEIRSKATLHALLAAALNYPDLPLTAQFKSGEFVEVLLQSLLSSTHSSLGESIERLKESCETGQSSEAAELLLEFEKDYTRMFFASKPRIAHLFESVYREGRLLQDSTFEIARLYYDAGLAPTEEFRLPPDHIALEFEFLSFLFFKEIDGIENEDKEVEEYARELQAIVVEKHLRPFALNIAAKVSQHAKTSFYKMVAAVMQSYYSA